MLSLEKDCGQYTPVRAWSRHLPTLPQSGRWAAQATSGQGGPPGKRQTLMNHCRWVLPVGSHRATRTAHWTGSVEKGTSALRSRSPNLQPSAITRGKIRPKQMEGPPIKR